VVEREAFDFEANPSEYLRMTVTYSFAETTPLVIGYPHATNAHQNLRGDEAAGPPPAVRAGADAIGIKLLSQSQTKHLDRTRSRNSSRMTAFVTAVGLFVDQPTKEVRETAMLLGLSMCNCMGTRRPKWWLNCANSAVLKVLRSDRSTLPAELERCGMRSNRWI